MNIVVLTQMSTHLNSILGKKIIFWKDIDKINNIIICQQKTVLI